MTDLEAIEALIRGQDQSPERGDRAHGRVMDRGHAARFADPAGLREAAVLVPLIRREAGLNVLLIQRSQALRNHAGQIAFPGGRIETHEADPAQAALRETWEEVGIAPDHVRVMGRLGRYVSGSGYRITPVVGEVSATAIARPDGIEAVDVFEAPLSFLMDPANRRRESREWNGERIHYYAIPFGERYIWGATAAILVMLSEALEPLLPGRIQA